MPTCAKCNCDTGLAERHRTERACLLALQEEVKFLRETLRVAAEEAAKRPIPPAKGGRK